VVFSNLPELSPDEVCEAMEERAQLSKRVRKPCYHISLTLPLADAREFDSDGWGELTAEFLNRMELSDRQAVAYLHEDAVYPDGGEERPHVHLVVNRVGEDGRCVDTSWDFYRAQTALRGAEERLSLTREKSSWEVERRRDSPGQVQRCRRETGEQLTVRTQLQESIDEAVEEASSLDGVADFLRGLGADVRISERGWSLKHERVAFQGSKLGRAYSAPAVAERAAAVEREPVRVDSSDWNEPVDPGSELAETVACYIRSYATVKGIPASGSVPTRLLGEIVADLDGDTHSLSIRDDDGMKFEAIQSDRRDSWDTFTDNLNDSERATLADLPQSPGEYVERANGRKVVRALRILAGHEFRKPKGGVRMPSGEGFDYLVRIDRREDGAHQITGTRSDSGDTVLRAGLRGGEATIEQSNIPAGFVDALAVQAERARRRRRARARDREREQDDELSL
jgi:hypothetical protein